jgi:hypothetical protein
MLSGRRRIGKTAPLLHWAEQRGLPCSCFAAENEPAPLPRRKRFATLLGRSPVAPTNPAFASRFDLWHATASFLGNRRQILVFDER